MALFWFLLALVLLVAALVILRLDSRQRGGGAHDQQSALGDGSAGSSGEGTEGDAAGVDADADGAVDVDDDDEDPHSAPPAEESDAADESAGDTGAPKLAPFQRAAGAAGLAGAAGAAAAGTVADADADADADAGTGTGTASGADAATADAAHTHTDPGTDTGTDTDTALGTTSESDAATAPDTPAADARAAEADSAEAKADSKIEATPDTKADSKTGAKPGAKPAATAGTKAAPAAPAVDSGADADAAADDEAVAAATAAGAYPAPSAQASSDPAPLDPSEPTVESSPRLLDRVRALLPARRAAGRATVPVDVEPVDPLAGSPVVRWLEDREFAPTPTPAPEFRHGDFAGGLSALGTVSHGVFRGRRAIMGVTGGRTVLALRRDTASDVVLDLSRPDIDTEPGFHDAGEVSVLEARTSDYGRLDLIDRDRLADSIQDVPASVRRVWAEGEWVAATIDGVDDPSGWDDVVMALHGAADVLAPFPPIGGRARALPAEMDPGAPAAAEGPEADPTMGMDGEVGTGTHGIAPLPDPEYHVVVEPPEAPDAGAAGDETTATTAPTSAFPAPGAASPGAAGQTGSLPKRAGHLRLVPDRPAARDLSDVPVVADRGDAADAPEAPDAATPDSVEDATTVDDAVMADATAVGPAADDAEAAEEPVAEEPDPFAEIMEQSGPVEARGDVAADHLEPRPPLSRPTRGVGQAYPEDATVPPLAAGVATGGAGIKPLGSEDDDDEIRDEVERFDAARIDGGSDFDAPSTGRHGAPRHGSGGRHGADDLDPSEMTQKLSVAELAERMGVDPAEMKSAGRRRRAKSDDGNDADAAAGMEPGSAAEGEGDEGTQGRERPGVEPDVERTARLDLPPDIKD